MTHTTPRFRRFGVSAAFISEGLVFCFFLPTCLRQFPPVARSARLFFANGVANGRPSARFPGPGPRTDQALAHAGDDAEIARIEGGRARYHRLGCPPSTRT